MTIVTICRTTSEHSFRVGFARMRNVYVWDAGKRAVFDVVSRCFHPVPECCKPVTIFKSCENFGCADVLLTRRAANKGSTVRRTREIAAGTCGRCDRSRMGQVGTSSESTKFPVQKAAERHHEAKPRPENRGNQMGSSRRRPSRASQTTRPRLVRSRVSRGTRVTSELMHPLDRETPSS